MSRSGKTGLDYFPFDVDFFIDEKIEFVSAKYEEKGELIAIKLLCKIYRSGYFLSWGQDESLLFAKRAGDNINQNNVDNVVAELLKRDFFNTKIYKKYNVLRSVGIQKRYFEATKRRKKVDATKEYLLVDVSEYNVNILELNVDINPQSKEEESKEEKRKEQYEISFTEFWQIFPARNGKKIDKPIAKEKFFKLKATDFATVIVAVHNYSESEMVKNGIGIKDPHRFLSNKDNKEYWKEWIEPEKITSKEPEERVIKKEVFN